MPVVVPAKAFEESNGQPLVLRGPIGQLVARPVIHADWDEHVLVNVERFGQPLREHVNNIVVCIRAVVKHGPNGCLPLLGLHYVVSVGCMKDKAFESQLAQMGKLRSSLEIGIGIVAQAVRALQETDLRVEIGIDLAMLRLEVQPVGAVGQSSARTGLSGSNSWCARLSGISG